MEERQVSVEGDAHPLPDPFAVIATQNPVEYEGTYPLPEAQLDRFLFKLQVGYPTAEQEQEVLHRHDLGLDPHDLAASGLAPVATAEHLAEGRRQVDALRVEDPVLAYVVAIVRATRESPSLALGVSPRGGASLLKAAKAWAWLAGRDYVTPDEVKAVALPALRHRLLLRPELVLEGVTADGVLAEHPGHRPRPSLARPSSVPIPTRRLAAVLAVASLAVLALPDRGLDVAAPRRRCSSWPSRWSTWLLTPAPGRIEVARDLPGVVSLGAEADHRLAAAQQLAVAGCGCWWPTSWPRRCGRGTAGCASASNRARRCGPRRPSARLVGAASSPARSWSG